MTHLECFHFVMWELFCLHMYVHVSVTHLDGLILPYGDFRLTCVLSSICDSSRRFNFVVWRLSAYMYTFICMPPITGICERAFTISKPQNRLLKHILEKAEGKCGAARQRFKWAGNRAYQTAVMASDRKLYRSTAAYPRFGERNWSDAMTGRSLTCLAASVYGVRSQQ